jgi:hypothetical protein
VVEPVDPFQGGVLEVVDALPGPRRRISSVLYSPMIVSARALMPLGQGVVGKGVGRAECAADLGEDLAGDVTLEQPEDLLRLAPVAVRRPA